ncbi:hypothetical protein QUA07_04925 [Microcoleus sp. T3_A4]|uniref:hypothetical protein n=1 Tax=Microcoleus sp. T3_A4 TaxID=2818968 RepID=UPI002FD55D5B
MSAQEQMKVVQSIYDQFFASLTEAPPGKPAVGSTDNIFVVIEKPGRLIRSKDFANPWSPGNTSGNQQAAVNLADLANEIPQVAAIYAPNSSRIIEIYQLILNAQVIPSPPNPQAEKAYEDAYKVLYTDVTKTDDDGVTTVNQFESQSFKGYKAKKKKYDDAVEIFGIKFKEANQTQDGRNNWPILGRRYQADVEDAWDAWRATDATKVEDALAAKDMTSNNAIGRAFFDAKKLLDSYKQLLEGIFYWRSRAIPSDWHDPAIAADWAVMEASSSSYVNETSSEFTSYGGGGGFGLGLWSFGGGFQSSEAKHQEQSESSNIVVRFKYATVTLDRPWLNYTLFKLPGWNVSGIQPKFFSNGTKQAQNNSLIPLLPQRFIVVQDVEITANWGQTDLDIIDKAISGSASVGWGPFSVSGSYSHSSSKETFKAERDGSTLKIPGMQIIGWICNVVPACPPQ